MLYRLAIVALASWAMVAPGAVRPAAAQIADGSRVLIMPFSVEVQAEAQGAAGAALWLGEAAAILLADDLAARGIRALDRDERVTAFDRLEMPASALLTRATLIRVGELIGATEIVYGEVKLADRLTIVARVIQVAPGRQTPDLTAQGDLPQMFDLFDGLAGQMVPPTRRAAAPLARDPDLPLQAVEGLVKGLVAASPDVQRRFLESALTQAPHDPRILTALWKVYTTASQHDRALAAASAVPAASPRSRRARFGAALSLIALRRFDGAIKVLSALDAERPNAPARNAHGVLQLRRAATPDAAAAVPLFRRAAEVEPSNTDYLFNLGYAYALAGVPAEALTWLREAVRHNAADADAHVVMSAVLAATGRRAEAQREFELARLLGTRLGGESGGVPQGVPPGLERLAMELEEGPLPRDVRAAPAQRDQVTTAAYHLQYGRRLFEAGQDREALAQLRRAAYLVPYDDEPHLLIGRIHRRGGRLTEAIDEFKVALWCRDSAEGQLALGDAQLEAGDRVAAHAAAARALVLDPGSTEARALIARIGGGGWATPVVLPSEKSR